MGCCDSRMQLLDRAAELTIVNKGGGYCLGIQGTEITANPDDFLTDLPAALAEYFTAVGSWIQI